MILSEAAEGGWGIAGTAYGKEEFVALAAAGRGVLLTLTDASWRDRLFDFDGHKCMAGKRKGSLLEVKRAEVAR